MRQSLRGKLTAAWNEIAVTEYVAQRINSEAYLQALLWERLNRLLPRDRYRLFIEPRFLIPEIRVAVKPDLVICNTRSAVAVIELKYEPRKKPKRFKDLRTLSLLAKNQERLAVSNNRYLVDGEQLISYPFASKALYVWAGYYRSDREPIGPLPLTITKALEGRFFSLHAVTRANTIPATYAV